MDNKVLYRYFNRETSESEEKLIANWLDESFDNQGIFQKEREYYNMSLLLGQKEQTIIHTPKRRFIPNWLKEVAKVAAVMLLTIGIGLYYLSVTKGDPSQAMHAINVPAGQRTNVILSDGTQICINAQSRLEYPSSFAEGDRRVKLTGEAYFNVAHDEDKPFIVEAGEYHIEVLGTSFNVESYPGENDFSTSLLEGKVKILNKNNEKEQVILEPNQQAKLINNKLAIAPIEDFDVLRWREGLICFKNKPFKELMEQFEKYYDVRIIIENDKLLEHELSGKIRVNDGVEHALRVIQKNTPFSYSFDNKLENVIYIK
ncbi:ferric-dicitrate binding protein FerR (iron transport regulator) [Dysgonomonas hofstadii]|uniref:Ferric-dicitrate binding protein FerR (Iron transport regulator) n=1 Tax=Dysgonomonas hofstadii TaxID=637886 RepID=A0A840CVU7_9BACT|nr:FecR domain-containing protein [Dysgonomonas hofstadii]MBB4038288.1 ferric-dicitrate binding protein FerR (iron transport regulator) [Dysgonomonas hofstadii]